MTGVLSPPLLPGCDVISNPRSTPAVCELQRWSGEVHVSAQVRGDAVLVRESEQVGYLPYINQVIEIH